MNKFISCVIFTFLCVPLFGQETLPQIEPPIPVYMIQENNHGSPTITDSVQRAREMEYLILQKKCDSLETQLHRSDVQTMSQFLWLSAFVAVMSIISIASFIVSIRLKRELAAFRHIVHSLPVHPLEPQMELPIAPVIHKEFIEAKKSPPRSSAKSSLRRRKK